MNEEPSPASAAWQDALLEAEATWCVEYIPIEPARYGNDGKPICRKCEKNKRAHAIRAILDKRAADAQQIAALRAENEQWKTWGVIEIAIRNVNIASYMNEWEGRTLKAEAQLAALRAENAELERHAWVAGEVMQEANNHSVALRQEIARLKRWGTELLVRELMAKERAETAEAQLTALQAEYAAAEQGLAEWQARVKSLQAENEELKGRIANALL